jgi:hypothetical protein
MTMSQALPPVPPRLHSAALAAAEHLTAIAHSEGIELGGLGGEALPHLITLLYVIRERCVEAEREPQPWLGDQAITPGEIAGVLETIAQVMMSDGNYNLARHNPGWFTDAARVVEQLGQNKLEHD